MTQNIIVKTDDGFPHGPFELVDNFPDVSKIGSENTKAAVLQAFGSSTEDNPTWEIFIAPEPIVPTLAEVKSQVTAAIRNQANVMREAITQGVTAAEAGAWTNKEAEAKIIQAGGTLEPGSMLQSEATASGKTVEQVAGRVLSHAQAWRGLEGQIAGTSSLHRAAVAALGSVEEVQSYEWSGGWPHVTA